MTNFTVKDLKEILEKLDESKEFQVVNYNTSDNIEVEYIKEIKEEGREYYKIYLH